MQQAPKQRRADRQVEQSKSLKSGVSSAAPESSNQLIHRASKVFS